MKTKYSIFIGNICFFLIAFAPLSCTSPEKNLLKERIQELNKKIDEVLNTNYEEVDIVDENGVSLLFLAVAFLNIEKVKELLDKGASPLLKDNEGKTAYDYLVQRSLLYPLKDIRKVVSLLRKHGTPPDEKWKKSVSFALSFNSKQQFSKRLLI